ncbi:MAG: hypothetical protein WD738_05400 [Pirellulales bacterium]
MLRYFSVRAFCALMWLLIPLAVHGADKKWTAAVSGDFADPARWTGGVPGAGDTASFNEAGTYTVTFDNAPNPLANPVHNQDLFVDGSTVTFTSGSGGPYTYRLTGAGGDDAAITSGALTLGTSGNPLHLTVDDDLLVRGGATLNVNHGSDVNTLDLLLATINGGGNGTIVVDGTNSQLNVTNGFSLAQNGNTGTLSYRNASQGTWSGTVNLGFSGNAATVAILNVESNADLNTGILNVGTGTAAATGTVNIHGSDSTLVQSVASTLTVGTAAAGIGAINIGTTIDGGTLSTGTGTLTINATGTVTIGSGANTGTLDANGDININGGLLQRANSTSTFNWASGKTMTIQNGGRFSVEGAYTTTLNAMYNITGSGSMLEITGSPANLLLTNGAEIHVSSGGHLAVSSAQGLGIGGPGGDGVLTVDGSGSTVTSPNGLFNNWGVTGGNATVTFSNDATGVFNGQISLALAGAAADVMIQSGADLSAGGLHLASNGGSATLNIQGSGSTFAQTDTDTIIVGHASTGAAVINIGTTASGAAFTSTGMLTINATGEVNIGSGANTGTLNANGDVTINGGVLTRGSSGTFELQSGKTMTIQNSGNASFAGSYNTANNAIYNVTGGGSILETLGAGSLHIGNGAQMSVNSGGVVSSAITSFIGTNGDGTLIVDGSGSTANGLIATWAGGGFTANVTFSNGAVGNFGSTSLANDSTTGTTANVDVLSGADLNLSGSLSLAANGGATTSATLDIQGSGSSVVQTGVSSVTVGHASEGTATINIGTTDSGATFDTGDGPLTINATGTVNVGSGANTGTLITEGVTINGGQLNRAQGSVFGLDAGRTLAIQNGGRASFDGGYSTSTATYNIDGAGSTLETVSGSFVVNSGGQVNVTSGGSLTSASLLSIGSTFFGTLTVDGPGSTVSAAGAGSNVWGGAGGAATVVFRNHAAGTFVGEIGLAGNTTAFDTDVTIESGADLAAGGLSLATLGGASSAANLTIRDAGSTVSLSLGTDLVIGHASTGTAVINVQDGGALTVGAGGETILNATGEINIDGGSVDLQTLTDNGGTINFVAGSLSYLGNLTVGIGGMLGTDLTLTGTRQLTLDGATTVDAFHSLTLDGGSISTGSLVVNGTFAFNSGTLSITGVGGLTVGSGGPFGSAFTLGAGRTLNVTNTTTISSGALFVLDSGSAFTSVTLANNGELAMNGLAATANATTVNNAGLIRGEGRIIAAVNNNAGGEIRAEFGKRIKIDGANGANAGRINLQGGTAEFTQALTNGSSGQILGRGTLSVGGTGLDNEGHVALSSGITDVFGDVTNDTADVTRGISVSGNADVTFWDDVTNVAGSLFRVSGGSSATFFGTFAGAGISGTGDVFLEADVTPGASPAIAEFGGNVSFGSHAELQIELAGVAAGSQHDRIDVAGTLSLDGALSVFLINGFNPAVNNSFDILDWGSLSGTFDSISLPALSGFVAWDTSNLYTTGVLAVAPALPGDFNVDGSVDAADYVVWRKGLGTAHTPDDFNVWRANFGATAGIGSGSAGASPAQTGVPEPGTVRLLAYAVLLAGTGLGSYRNRLPCSNKYP